MRATDIVTQLEDGLAYPTRRPIGKTFPDTGHETRCERFAESVRYLDDIEERYRSLVAFLYAEGLEMDDAAVRAADIMSDEYADAVGIKQG
jgi:hypothetical protein